MGATHVLQTIVSRINGATGEVEVNPDTLFTRAGQTVFVCPTTNGGKNWEASAYSPLTNFMYVPLRNTCAQGTAVAESRKNTSLYGVAYKEAQAAPNSGGKVGTIYAISARPASLRGSSSSGPAPCPSSRRGAACCSAAT